MDNKFLDFLLPIVRIIINPITGGAGGGVYGAVNSPICVLTLANCIETVVSALIFAVIGGVIGYYVNKLLKNIDKKH